MPFVEYLVKQSTVLDWLQLGLAQCVSVPKTYDPFELSLYFWLSSDQIMHIHVVRIILVLNVIILFFFGGGGCMVKYDNYNNEFGTKEKRSNQG